MGAIDSFDFDSFFFRCKKYEWVSKKCVKSIVKHENTQTHMLLFQFSVYSMNDNWTKRLWMDSVFYFQKLKTEKLRCKIFELNCERSTIHTRNRFECVFIKWFICFGLVWCDFANLFIIFFFHSTKIQK